MLIDYGKDINKFYPKEVAHILGIIFPIYGDNTYNLVIDWYTQLNNQYYKRPLKVEILKDLLEEEKSNYFSGRGLTITKLKDIHDSLKQSSKIEIDNFMMTLFRSWEWPYYTDQEMENFNKEIADRIREEKVSLWKYSKCAYKGELSSSWLEDINIQWENISNYCNQNGLKMIDYDRLLESVEILLDMIEGKRPVPEGLRSSITQWQEIRSKIPKVVREMDKSEEEGMLVNSIMTKQSGSLWNSVPLLREMFRDCGYGKITNVLGNFIASSRCILHPNFYKDLIDINQWLPDFNPNYLTLVCGKGDGYKIRYVGQAATIYQNYLNPIFRMTKSVMENNPKIAVYDQSSKFLEMCEKCNDMFGIDFSGYSDFLSRNLIKMLLDLIYQVPKRITDKIMYILSMPIKIGNEYFDYKYGTLQGIMFDFNAITDCNQLMWVLGCIYSDFYDESVFCGDDRGEGTTDNYPEGFINNQMVISVCCNCVTNHSKTESWSKDGIVTFCHITYSKDRLPVSGLSANSVLKQKRFITDLNSIFKVFQKTGYWDKFDVSYWDKMVDLMIASNIINGNMTDQYNRLHRSKYNKQDIRNRLLLARSVPIEYGGLSCDDISTDLDLYLNVLRVQLLKYMEWDMEIKAEMNYGFLNELNDQDVPLINTAYGKQLFQPSNTINEIQETLKLIDLCLKERNENSRTNLDQLKVIKRKFSSIVRSIEYDGNENKSVSTKNRVSVKMDSDKAFDNFIEARNLTLEDKDKTLELSAKGLNEFCFLDSIAIASDRRYLFNLYLTYKRLAHKFQSQMRYYEGFGHNNYFGYFSPSLKSMIRIEVDSDKPYNGSWYHFEDFAKLPDEEKQYIISYCLLMDQSKDSRLKYGVSKDRLKSRIKDYLRSQYTSTRGYAEDIGLSARDFFSISHSVMYSDMKDVDDFFRL